MFRRIGVWLALALLTPALSAAQAIDPGVLYRVFLKDGRALPTYGEFAQVDGRLVFVLAIGDPATNVELQLMSLPLVAVDMERTSRFAEGTRARRYAETRGPADYSAIGAAVSIALAEVEKEPDPKVRLQKAEEARAKLIAWPNAHFAYRAAEVRELASLFDDVISDLRAAAQLPRLSMSLVAGPVLATYDPPLPSPTRRDSIELALAAAEMADVAEDRIAILRAALSATGEEPAEIRTEVSRRLVAELNADAAYARLASEITLRADAAMRRGDVKTVSGLVETLPERDRALGGLRPLHIQTLRDRLGTMLERARAFRLELDHWAASLKEFVAYEQRIRPITSSMDGLRPVLMAIQDMSGPPFSRLVAALTNLNALSTRLRRVEPPADLMAMHSTLVSALFMASQAAERRSHAVKSANLAVARDASSAAAGAIMLLSQARADLLLQLAPPRFK